jgi:hypothetical protein
MTQKTQCVTIINLNWLRVYRTVVGIYCKNNTEHMKAPRQQNTEFFSATANGTYRKY